MSIAIVKLQYTFVLFLYVAGIHSIHAQDENSSDSRTPYYLDFNAARETTIHDLQDELLNIQYHDSYGQNKEIPLKVYNWKREEVAAYALSKTYGLNHFTVNLSSLFNAWKEGDIYTFELLDESRHRYALLVRKIAPPDKEKPLVNIFVNPLHLECETLNGNVVEFYGAISGGKAPYKVNWYILNDNRTDFLYQPREEIIERPGNTMVIRVDKNPDYYVLLQVKDACGNKQKQMVHLVCEDEKKKINTIFVEPLDLLKQNKIGN